MDLREIAMHEAGHAVVAYRLGIRIKYVTIVETENASGHVQLHKLPASLLRAFDSNNFAPRERVLLENHMMVDLAGGLVTDKIDDPDDPVPCSADLAHLIDYAVCICGDEKEAEAYINWILIRTKNLISVPCNQQAITCLADALMERKTISDKEAREIICKGLSKREAI